MAYHVLILPLINHWYYIWKSAFPGFSVADSYLIFSIPTYHHRNHHIMQGISQDSFWSSKTNGYLPPFPFLLIFNFLGYPLFKQLWFDCKIWCRMQSTYFVNDSWILHSYPDVSLHWHTGDEWRVYEDDQPRVTIDVQRCTRYTNIIQLLLGCSWFLQHIKTLTTMI